jgi:hypothetical protein
MFKINEKGNMMEKLHYSQESIYEMVNQIMDLFLYKRYRDKNLSPKMSWKEYLSKYEFGYLDRRNMFGKIYDKMEY